MKSLRPVVWHAGMHLAHHHFQLRDRYFTDSAAFALDSVLFCPYGLTRLELEHESLLNGSVRVTEAAGIMPDGLTFSFPEDEPPQEIEHVREQFSPTSQSHLVLLTIPAYRHGRPNLEFDGAGPGRFVIEEREVADEYGDSGELSVKFARKNFHLALDNEEIGADAVALPIARLRRDRGGDLEYDPDFVPPCVRIGASDRLLRLLQRLTEMLTARASMLVSNRIGMRGGEYGDDEIVSFWLSHAIQSSLAPLRHQLLARAAHPEEAYRELLRLAGALCTFSMDARIDDLPAYDHDDLTESFSAIERHIEKHLDVVLPRQALRAVLRPFEDFLFVARVPARMVKEDARWYLEAVVSGSHAEAIENVPDLVKVCLAGQEPRGGVIRRLRDHHAGGMLIEHLSSTPPGVTRRPGAEYFSIARDDGPCWQGLRAESVENDSVEVGLYIPEAVADLEIGLVIATDD